MPSLRSRRPTGVVLTACVFSVSCQAYDTNGCKYRYQRDTGCQTNDDCDAREVCRRSTGTSEAIFFGPDDSVGVCDPGLPCSVDADCSGGRHCQIYAGQRADNPFQSDVADFGECECPEGAGYGVFGHGGGGAAALACPGYTTSTGEFTGSSGGLASSASTGGTGGASSSGGG